MTHSFLSNDRRHHLVFRQTWPPSLRQGKRGPSWGQPILLTSFSTVLTRGTRSSRLIRCPRAVLLALATQTCHMTHFLTMATTTTVMASSPKKNVRPSSIMRQGSHRGRLGGVLLRTSCSVKAAVGATLVHPPKGGAAATALFGSSSFFRLAHPTLPDFTYLSSLLPVLPRQLLGDFPELLLLVVFYIVWSAHILIRSSFNILSIVSLVHLTFPIIYTPYITDLGVFGKFLRPQS